MSTCSSSSSKKIVLKSEDGEPFEMDERAALESQVIKHMIEDGSADDPIPLAYTSKTVSKVIEYCNKLAELSNKDDEKAAEDLKTFDAEFVKQDVDIIQDILLAANFLSIEKLVNLMCQAIADMMKGKDPDEIRRMLKIENDLTPEEIAAARAENAWAFD